MEEVQVVRSVRCQAAIGEEVAFMGRVVRALPRRQPGGSRPAERRWSAPIPTRTGRRPRRSRPPSRRGRGARRSSETCGAGACGPRAETAASHSAMGSGSSMRDVHGEWQGHTGEPACQAHRSHAPAIARMNTGCRRVDLRVPANGRSAADAELEDSGHCRAARDAPVRHVPARGATSFERQACIDGVVAEVGQVDRDGGSRAAAPTRLKQEMVGRRRVTEVLGADQQGGAPADGRLAALEFLDGEIDATLQQGVKSPLDPLPSHQALEVAVLAPGQLQQAEVRAPGVLVHRRS